MIKVEGYPHLYRDENTGSIINTDTTGYRSRLNIISSIENEKNELKRMRGEIDELKSLLKELVNSKYK
jgi:hypothetical protein